MRRYRIAVLVLGIILLIGLAVAVHPAYHYAEMKRDQLHRIPSDGKPGQKKFPLLVGAALLLVALPIFWVDRYLSRYSTAEKTG